MVEIYKKRLNPFMIFLSTTPENKCWTKWEANPGLWLKMAMSIFQYTGVKMCVWVGVWHAQDKDDRLFA